MRSILGFALSLGFSLIVTWAGLHFDNGLVYVGIALIGAVLLAYVYSWSFPKPAPVQYVQAPPEPEPEPKDDKERALRALSKARNNGVAALKSRKEGQAHTAVNQLRAAMLSADKQFGIGTLNIHHAGSFAAIVNAYVHLIDEIYPLLKEGHIEEARKHAANWKIGY